MFSVFLSACVLMIVTVAIHATGIAWLVRRLTRLRPMPTSVWLIRRMLPHNLVAGPAASGRDFDVGLVLPVARVCD